MDGRGFLLVKTDLTSAAAAEVPRISMSSAVLSNLDKIRILARTGGAAMVFAVSVVMAQAQTSPFIPQQLHNPEMCAKSDVACIETAYAEYKDALLSEVEESRWLEGRIAKVVASQNENAAAVLQGEIMSRGLNVHVHFQWKFPSPVQMLLTKIPFDEYDALISDCRSAVITLKYLLISRGHDDQQDQQYYRESMNRCEKQFHLHPVLGGFGRPSSTAYALGAKSDDVETVIETIGRQAVSLSTAARKERHEPRDILAKVKGIEASTHKLRAELVQKVGKEAETKEELPADTAVEEFNLRRTDPLRLIFQDERSLEAQVASGAVETDIIAIADTADNLKDDAEAYTGKSIE